jgi:hypothetical protein
MTDSCSLEYESGPSPLKLCGDSFQDFYNNKKDKNFNDSDSFHSGMISDEDSFTSGFINHENHSTNLYSPMNFSLKEGTVFDSLDIFDIHLREYSNREGFDLGKKNTKDGNQREYRCTSILSATNKCKWKYLVVKRDDGKFYAENVFAQHNHSLLEIDRLKCSEFRLNIYGVAKKSRRKRSF